MNVLELFAGIGGIGLGLERAGMTVVGQVEIDPYCNRVLAKHWPEVPRHDDVRTCTDWWQSQPRPHVELISGGFPCQDISNAGRRAGIVEGTRSSLWAHMADCVRELRPRYLLVENVAALLVRGLDVVLADLAAIGYDAEWDCLPAAAVGAPHRRDRIWLVAYPQRQGPQGHGAECGLREGGGEGEAGGCGQRTDVADPEVIAVRPGLRPNQPPRLGWRRPSHSGSATEQWAAEPDVGRVAHGVPARVDRLRALGNAVVPQVAEHVGRLILTADRGVAA